MHSHLELPRSSDDPLVATSDRPVDLEAGQTVEADPPSAHEYALGLPPGATVQAEASTPVVPPDSAPVPAQAQPASAPATAAAGSTPSSGPRLVRPRRRVKKRWDAPAWVVSALIHLGILGMLAAVATTSGEVIKQIANLDTALIASDAPVEETPIYAEQSNVPRTDAVENPNVEPGNPSTTYSASSGGSAGALVLKSTGRAMGARTALPTIGTVSAPSNLSMVSSTPTRDLGGAGMVGGDPTHAVGEVGDALDQIAREILRHLTQHRLTVIWMFDESESMRDDQKAIKGKFDRVVNELKINTPDDVSTEPGRGGWFVR